MDPDNNVLMARVAEGQGLGEGGQKGWKMGDICNSVNKKNNKKNES